MLSSSFQDESTVIPSISIQRKNTIEHSGQFGEQIWTKSSPMKGNKISLKQYRKKQALKTQNINHLASKNYTHLHTNQVIFANEDLWGEENSKTQGLHHPNQSVPMNRRNGYSADPTYRNRRKQLQEEADNIRSRTMMVTSSNATRKRSKTMRSFHMFNSSNLGTRMNEYMNIFIRQTHAGRIQNLEKSFSPQNNLTALNNLNITQDMSNYFGSVIPHKKKLTSFERKIKSSKKNAFGKQEKKRNIQDQELSAFSKTLNLQVMKSPLVSNLDLKRSLMQTVRNKGGAEKTEKEKKKKKFLF